MYANSKPTEYVWKSCKNCNFYKVGRDAALRTHTHTHTPSWGVVRLFQKRFLDLSQNVILIKTSNGECSPWSDDKAYATGWLTEYASEYEKGTKFLQSQMQCQTLHFTVCVCVCVCACVCVCLCVCEPVCVLVGKLPCFGSEVKHQL